MRTIIITVGFLLTATSTYGGVVRRSVNKKPYNSAKELLQMKGASDAIRKGFQSAGSELHDLAKKLEDEVKDLSDLTAYLDLKETERMKDALAEAMNIKSLMDAQRTELSGLAKTTIDKCTKIREKFEEMAAKKKKIDSGMRSVLRKMRSLLQTSETKLKEAKEVIIELTEKVNEVLAGLRVFKGLIEAAKEQDEALDNTGQYISEISGGIIKSIKNGFDGYKKAKDDDKTMSVVNSIFDGITSLTASVVKILEKPEIGPMVEEALESVNEAVTIIEKQKAFMGKELELVIIWKNAVEEVKNTVFNSDLEESEDGDLYEEIEEMIEDEDMDDIYDAFDGLKDAAQAYLNQVKESCPSCIV